MGKTPGFIMPMSFPDDAALVRKLRDQAKNAGFTPWDEIDLSHSNEDPVSEILSHFGIKGMRWGVRRSSAQLDAHSEDKAKALETASKIKANRGSTASVSNKELQHLLDRMNLEQRHSKMLEDQSQLNKGNKQIKKFLETGKTLRELDNFLGGTAQKNISKSLAKLLAKALAAPVKSAAKKATGR
jgi:hypothetical protein